MIVLKFGGTSVEDAPALRRLERIVRAELHRAPVVVVSACSGVTNALLQLGRQAATGDVAGARLKVQSLAARHLSIVRDLWEGRDGAATADMVHTLHQELSMIVEGIAILGELTDRSLDLVASFGERLSSGIIAAWLDAAGLPTTLVDARKFMITDARFTRAVPDQDRLALELRSQVAPHAAPGRVVLTQGFIGATPDGVTTTIGRGGSDYSAALIGAHAGADEIQIWTDVDGILTADPTVVADARRIKVMSFAEASELAYFGARVLHPETILPAVIRDIPVLVLNSRKPESPGTRIVAAPATDRRCIVKSIAYKERITLVTIVSTRMFLAHGFLENVFDVFHKYSTVVHTVAASDVSLTASINDTSRLEAIVRELQAFSTVTVDAGRALVCVVGDNLRNSAGLASRVLSTITDININMIAQGASEINISFVVDETAVEEVVRRLHHEFFQDMSGLEDLFEAAGR